jgi:hypothetical protein
MGLKDVIKEFADGQILEGLNRRGCSIRLGSWALMTSCRAVVNCETPRDSTNLLHLR